MSYSGRGRYISNSHWIADNSLKWIETSSGVIHISAKALNIIWGNDKRFWQWVPVSKDLSHFGTAAELIQVNWLQVKGTLDLAKCNLPRDRRYEIVYVVKFKVDAFGWQEAPVIFQVATPNGQRFYRPVTLDASRSGRGEWLEIRGGEFTTHSKMAGKLEFSMSETKTNWWKGGLVLEGVIIRPKLV